MQAAKGRDVAVAALAVEDVRVEYRHGDIAVHALDGISLGLESGEIVGLIGPNGSGKTSLIRAITKVAPYQGRIVLMGRDVSVLGQQAVARLAAVSPQEAILPEGFTALACVMMGRTAHLRLLENEGVRDFAAARRAMIATDIWPLAERRVGELSGGERQRVVLARALAQETPVLLLDEPTAHLDIGHQAAVLGLVRSVTADQNKGVLAVVHDLTLAAQYCDRLVLLRKGRAVAVGRPEDVLLTEILREVYGVDVRILSHPDTGRPVVAPVRDGA